MASKYQQQAKATKKKRKVSKLGQAMKAQRKLTPAEQRRMKILGAKATTAKAKASAAAMDKRIAKIKKGK